MTYMYICGMARKDGTKAMFILQNKHCQDYPWTYRAFQNLPFPSVKFSWSLELDALDEAETEKLAKALKLVSLADLWADEPVEVCKRRKWEYRLTTFTKYTARCSTCTDNMDSVQLAILCKGWEMGVVDRTIGHSYCMLLFHLQGLPASVDLWWCNHLTEGACPTTVSLPLRWTREQGKSFSLRLRGHPWPAGDGDKVMYSLSHTLSLSIVAKYSIP